MYKITKRLSFVCAISQATLKDFSMQTLNKSPAEIGALSRERLLTIRQSDDGREGGQAFAEKRTPEFKGH